MAINFARQKFSAAIGRAIGAWSLAARAQQPDRARHVGVRMGDGTKFDAVVQPSFSRAKAYVLKNHRPDGKQIRQGQGFRLPRRWRSS